jgi:phospholipid/cholesterol/gamma-HCH transport system substrate-binding protein
VFKGVSKETKVGSLTALAITVLILGYNYMVGKDNPFKGSREFYVFYDSAPDVAVSTPVLFNGIRIGQVKKVWLDEETGKPVVRLEIFGETKIPKHSFVKIQSELLGGVKLKLRLSADKVLAEDGDTLRAEYDKDVMSMVNEKVAPIAAGVDSLITNLNMLIHRASVQQAFDQLPILIGTVTQTLNNVKEMIANLQPGVTSSVNNIADFSKNLDSYGKSIDQSLKSFDKLGKQLDSVQLVRLTKNLEATMASLSAIAADIQSGKGTLGKLSQDEQLYNDLVQTNQSLQCLMNDIKAYPQKYLPLPWGKKQRKKAMAESKAANTCFPTKDSAR